MTDDEMIEKRAQKGQRVLAGLIGGGDVNENAPPSPKRLRYLNVWSLVGGTVLGRIKCGLVGGKYATGSGIWAFESPCQT